jgi:hypothetical protein
MFLIPLLKDSLRERAKHLSAFAVSIIFAVAALPALAQQQQTSRMPARKAIFMRVEVPVFIAGLAAESDVLVST